MSEPSPEPICGLRIDPALLADIRRQCQERRAELEAAGRLPCLTIAPGSHMSAFAALPASPPITEAERFAAAIENMPARIRAFFEHEDPVSPHRWESTEDREERQRRASLGGWPGG